MSQCNNNKNNNIGLWTASLAFYSTTAFDATTGGGYCGTCNKCDRCRYYYRNHLSHLWRYKCCCCCCRRWRCHETYHNNVVIVLVDGRSGTYSTFLASHTPITTLVHSLARHGGCSHIRGSLLGVVVCKRGLLDHFLSQHKLSRCLHLSFGHTR